MGIKQNIECRHRYGISGTTDHCFSRILPQQKFQPVAEFTRADIFRTQNHDAEHRKTSNIGFDLSITSVNIQKKNFTWTTNFNVSHNRNKIEALSGEQYFLEEARFGYDQKTHKIEVGKPIGQFYGYKTLGLYQVEDFDYNAKDQTYTLKEGIPYMSGTFNRSDIRPGMWKFDDRNGDKVIDDSDMTVIGNANPDFYGGLNNLFKYKGWDFNFFFTFSYGGEVLNATKLTNTKTATTNYSVLNIANSSNRWMTVNSEGQLITDPEEMAAINAGKTVACIYDMEAGDKYIHSWAVEDASYLRLSNVSLGYTFDRKNCVSSMFKACVSTSPAVTSSYGHHIAASIRKYPPKGIT